MRLILAHCISNFQARPIAIGSTGHHVAGFLKAFQLSGWVWGSVAMTVTVTKTNVYEHFFLEVSCGKYPIIKYIEFLLHYITLLFSGSSLWCQTVLSVSLPMRVKNAITVVVYEHFLALDYLFWCLRALSTGTFHSSKNAFLSENLFFPSTNTYLSHWNLDF